MRMVWSLIRAAILLFGLVTLLVTPVFVSGPSGTSVDPEGAWIDLLALAALVLAVEGLWRDLGSR